MRATFWAWVLWLFWCCHMMSHQHHVAWSWTNWCRSKLPRPNDFFIRSLFQFFLDVVVVFVPSPLSSSIHCSRMRTHSYHTRLRIILFFAWIGKYNLFFLVHYYYFYFVLHFFNGMNKGFAANFVVVFLKKIKIVLFFFCHRSAELPHEPQKKIHYMAGSSVRWRRRWQLKFIIFSCW